MRAEEMAAIKAKSQSKPKYADTNSKPSGGPAKTFSSTSAANGGGEINLARKRGAGKESGGGGCSIL